MPCRDCKGNRNINPALKQVPPALKSFDPFLETDEEDEDETDPQSWKIKAIHDKAAEFPNSFHPSQNDGARMVLSANVFNDLGILFQSLLFVDNLWKPFFDKILSNVQFSFPMPGNKEPVQVTKINIVKFSNPKLFEMKPIHNEGIQVTFDRFAVEVELPYIADGKPGSMRIICQDTHISTMIKIRIDPIPGSTHDERAIMLGLKEPTFKCYSRLQNRNNGNMGNFFIRQGMRMGNWFFLNNIVRGQASKYTTNTLNKISFTIPMNLITSALNSAYKTIFHADFGLQDRVKFVNPAVDVHEHEVVLRSGIQMDHNGLLGLSKDYELWFVQDPPVKWELKVDSLGRFLLPVTRQPPASAFGFQDPKTLKQTFKGFTDPLKDSLKNSISRSSLSPSLIRNSFQGLTRKRPSLVS